MTANRCPATRKHRWRTEEQANHALRTILTKGKQRDRMPCRVYACPMCSGWHLSSQPEDAGRAVGAPPRHEPTPELTPIQAAERDRDELVAVIERHIAADHCGDLMYDPGWQAFRLRHLHDHDAPDGSATP